MNFLRCIFLSLILGAYFIPMTFAQQHEAPDALVQRISEEVLQQARTDQEIQRGNHARILDLVRQKILPHVDIKRMTSLAAGRYWRRASPAQQQRLSAEFRDLLIYVYSGALAQTENYEIVVEPLRGNPSKGEVIVRTAVLQPRGREPIDLDYRMALEDSGWKVYDVSILGVWLVQSYRGSFANEIRASGIDGLIRTLAEKNRRLAAKMAGGANKSGGS